MDATTRKTMSTKKMLLPPRLDRRGTQLAGWRPSSKPEALAAGILFDEDVPITLPDGTVLMADIFRPAGAGPVPALLAWAVYIKDTERMGGGPFIDESGVHPYVIRRGYAVVRVQPRGTGKSGGVAPAEMSPPAEFQDCHDAIEWAAAQTWCDGKVGMTGMSYFGMAQLHVAATRPPSLRAIFPYKAMTDVYRMGFFKGGAPYTGAIELFAGFEKTVPPKIPSWLRHLASRVLNTSRFEMAMSDPVKTRKSVRNFIKSRPPGEAAIRGYVSRLFDHVFDDGDYWQKLSVGPKIEKIDIPVCIATDYGAQGFHFFGAFELWHRLKCEKFLFFGPPEYIFPWSNYQEELVAWYDWQLKDIDNGYAALPRVRFWLRGAERWEGAQDWPLPEAAPARFYLAAGPEGLLQEPPMPGTTSFLAVPGASYYVPQIDDYETQILRYRTGAFVTETKVVGPVKLHLTLASSNIDTYIVARLNAIAPDGKRMKLAWGWLLASHRRIDEARSNPTEIVHDHSSAAARALTPHEPVTIEFSLTPVACLFAVGDVMELEIASRPDLLYSEKGEGFDMFCWDPVPYWARNTVHHGGGAPSWLEISICPADRITA